MTRYPKSGKGKKWTLLELKAIPDAWAGDTINDSNGLVGDIRVASNSPDGHSKCSTYGQSNCSTPVTVN
jgi:hypothetical protein